MMFFKIGWAIGALNDPDFQRFNSCHLACMNRNTRKQSVNKVILLEKMNNRMQSTTQAKKVTRPSVDHPTWKSSSFMIRKQN